MNCPECKSALNPQRKSCNGCGWSRKTDWKASSDKDVNPMETTPVWIGETQTWVKRCNWRGLDRCCRAARSTDFCEWHSHCLVSGQRADDFESFSEWFSSSKGGWSVGEAFRAATGEDDPYHDMRINFGLKKYESNLQSKNDTAANLDFIRAVATWQKSGILVGQKAMNKLSEKYPEYAAQFLIAEKQIADFSTLVGLNVSNICQES